MPAVVTGTVVRWEVVPEGEQKKPRVRFKDAKDVSVYVVDEDAEASAIAPAIITQGELVGAEHLKLRLRLQLRLHLRPQPSGDYTYRRQLRRKPTGGCS